MPYNVEKKLLYVTFFKSNRVHNYDMDDILLLFLVIYAIVATVGKVLLFKPWDI